MDLQGHLKFPKCDYPLHFFGVGEEKLHFANHPLYEGHTHEHLSETLREAVKEWKMERATAQSLLLQMMQKT